MYGSWNNTSTPILVKITIKILIISMADAKLGLTTKHKQHTKLLKQHPYK